MHAFVAVLLLAIALPCAAADEDLKAEIKRLRERIEALEKAQQRVDEGLAREEISEREPELTSRLKAVEYQALGMLKQARTVEALQGITVGVSFTTVAQRPSENLNSQLNYRADVFAGLPLERIGDVESRLFASIRFGQGNGLNDFYSYSKPNASAFRVTAVSPDDSVAILGQAWYQATIPLPFGGFKPHSKENLELNFGKMDPFVFFDQNAPANDETRQFLNTVFVHNALLDAGGDVGFDANGFSPGFRASYYNYTDKRQPWRLSAGVFGAGEGARYTNSFASTLAIVQADKQFQLAAGLPGNYRLYAWRNSAAPTFTGETESRRGIGASLDQRVSDATTLFARYGHQTRGNAMRFDRALTGGAEIRGPSWNRSGDSIGIAYGWLRTASAFHDASGYAAAGSEQVAELYYRYRINKQFELSPDLQFIRHPGGNPDTRYDYFTGLRAQITY